MAFAIPAAKNIPGPKHVESKVKSGAGSLAPLVSPALAKKDQQQMCVAIETTNTAAQTIMDIETASTAAASTTATSAPGKKVEFDDDVNSGPGSDMETRVASERSSKSRTSSCRSSGTKKKKMEKYAAYIAAKKAAAGETMVPWEKQHAFMVTDEDRAARASESFVPASSEARSSKDAVIINAAVDQSTAIDAMHKIKAMADERKTDIWSRLFGGQTVMKTVSAADIRLLEQRMTHPGDEDYCMACKKHGLKWSSHRTSKDHQKMMQWHAGCDALMGKTDGPREWCNGFIPSPPNNIMDEADLKKFWGKEVMSMDKKAMQILKKTGIRVKPSKNGKSYVIEPHFIEGVSLAFVEFAPMTGKYDGGKARMRWPHQLPATIKPSATSLTDRLSWWPVVATSFAKEMESQLAMYMEADAVEAIEDNDDIILWDGTEEDWVPDGVYDVSVEVPVGGGTMIRIGCRCIWFCCQAQLQWDMPEAWPFPLRSRS